MSKKSRERSKRRRRAAQERGDIKFRCGALCNCLCHVTGGGVHDHPGRPCPGKVIHMERITRAEAERRYPPTKKETR